MSKPEGCTCDYSYTCPLCRALIDAANQEQYFDELRDWTVESLKLLASKLGVELPQEPQKRERGW